jgi:uncharacterized protein YndB with AHSA1/START domain
MNSGTFEPGPLVDVDCVPADTGWTLVFIRDLLHPPERVWAALTEPRQLEQWAPFLADRNLGSTGKATLTMIDGDARVELPVAEVKVAEPPTLLEYTWGTDLLRWELAALPDGTRLTLRHTVADRDMASKVAAGWHLCLDVADRLLDGHPVPPIRGERARDFGWDKLRESYAQRLDRGGAADG